MGSSKKNETYSNGLFRCLSQQRIDVTGITHLEQAENPARSLPLKELPASGVGAQVSLSTAPS